MNRPRYHQYVLSVCLIAILISPEGFSQIRKWNKKMQKLAATFSDVLPELSDSKPITATTQKKLEKGAKKILELAHTINMGPGTKGNPLPPEADPSIGFISNMFEREVKHAYQALKAGHTSYAKAVLRTTTGYCIACHSRHDKGPDFTSSEMNKKLTATLSPMERAKLFAATRQFDAALDGFEKIATDPKLASENAIQWGKAIRYALNLNIRVKNDPERTLKFISDVMALPQIPGFYTAHLPLWKDQIVEWKNEKKKSLETEEELYQEAKRLSAEAQKKQRYPLDRASDVLYLRSSAIVHELLTRFPQGKYTSEAFFLAGSAYDLLEDRLTTPLPEIYYEVCVRHSPHTEIAGQCFSRFEQDILFGYTGSAGTFVPEEVQKLVNELRALAKPAEKP